MENRKLELIESVKKFYEVNQRYPTNKEVEDELDMPRRTLRRYFNNLGNLISVCKQSIEEPMFTEKRASDVKKVIKAHKRFVITTAVIGADVDLKALASIKNYCKRNDAALLIIPCIDSTTNVSDGLDEHLRNENIVFENVSLNENISIFALRLSAKQVNSITGLGRIGKRNHSTIFPSPKQTLEYVSVGNNQLPHALMTTGCITKPAYVSSPYLTKRNEYIAEFDHLLGAVICEIKNSKIYHFRQIQFKEDGSFTDLGVKYTATAAKKIGVVSMVLGDWHSGGTCETVRRTTYAMMKELKPAEVVLHDLYNGLAINHHSEFMSVTKARSNPPTLEEEFTITRDDLLVFKKLTPNVVVVASNHDYWIDRYLEESRFIRDARNYRISLDLAAAKFDGKHTLEFALFRDKTPSGIKFLRRDEDHIRFGFQLGSHGDLEGSLVRIEKSFGKAITGHSHTPAILRGVFRVGTSTELRESYVKGACAWVNCHAIINNDGSVQLLNIIEGEWKL